MRSAEIDGWHATGITLIYRIVGTLIIERSNIDDTPPEHGPPRILTDRVCICIGEGKVVSRDMHAVGLHDLFPGMRNVRL